MINGLVTNNLKRVIPDFMFQSFGCQHEIKLDVNIDFCLSFI